MWYQYPFSCGSDLKPQAFSEVHQRGEKQDDAVPGCGLVRTLIEHFRRDFPASLTLQNFSEEYGYSTFAIIRAFRRLTGITPMRYLSVLRHYEAKQMLLDTDCSVISICYDVGYESLGSFNNRFKALVGLTPTELRKLRDFLNPRLLLPKCHFDKNGELQLRVAAYFKAGFPYSCIADLHCETRVQPPVCGYSVVAFAIPWIDDVRSILLPQRVLRSEPTEAGSRICAGSLQCVRMRPSTEFDPPLLPVLVASQAKETSRTL